MKTCLKETIRSFFPASVLLTALLAAPQVSCVAPVEPSEGDAEEDTTETASLALGLGDGYSHDPDVQSPLADWMSLIDGTQPLGALSIPGTHDTMSSVALHGDAVMNQTMSLQTQLASGIRALDIRIHDADGSLACHHGSFFLFADLHDVLSTAADFLDAHPGETILMRIKQEASSNPSFATHVGDALQIYAPYLWKNETAATNPTLNDVRGKIVILRDGFALAGTGHDRSWGLDYAGLSIQDQWSLSTNWDLYGVKWPAVRNHLNAANTGAANGRIHMNYLSAATGSFPYFVASGKSSPGTHHPQLFTGVTVWNANDSWCFGVRNPCPDGTLTVYATTCTNSCYFQGTNQLAADYIRTNGLAHTGILMMDFPGAGIIGTIVDRNPHASHRRRRPAASTPSPRASTGPPPSASPPPTPSSLATSTIPRSPRVQPPLRAASR